MCIASGYPRVFRATVSKQADARFESQMMRRRALTVILSVAIAWLVAMRIWPSRLDPTYTQKLTFNCPRHPPEQPVQGKWVRATREFEGQMDEWVCDVDGWRYLGEVLR